MKPRDSPKDYNKETLRAWPEALSPGLLKKSVSFLGSMEVHATRAGPMVL